MKLDAHKDWDHPERGPLVRHAKVYLDGEEVQYCILADEEANYVLRFKTDDKGALIRDGDEIATERLEGKVTIVDTRERKVFRA